MVRKLGCFYLDSIGAKGNAKFQRMAKSVENFDHKECSIYYSANRMAYECHSTKKRNRVYKRENRKLIDMWWTVYYRTGFKLNGIDLGSLYLLRYGSDL